MTLYHNKDV